MRPALSGRIPFRPQMKKKELAQQPLTFLLQLTDEQRRQILEQTGKAFAALPIKTRASSIRVQFAGLTLRVARGVFVPAAVTERLLESALSATPPGKNPAIVEVGTGCGAIALALAHANPDARIHASDISEVALRCARQNRKELAVGNVHFCLGSLLAPIPARLKRQVATIVANVPYAPPSYAGALNHFYPDGTAIGMGRRPWAGSELAGQARHFLAPGGSLVLQLAGFQWKGFTEELRAFGYGTPDFQRQPIEEQAPAAARIRFAASR
jgi:release factor glutamine methyltransferase